MTFRKFIFWLHLIAGVVAGVVVFTMSVTGVMLAYERQIQTRADGNRVSPSASKPIPIETLLAKIRETQSNAVPSMVTFRADPTAPLLLNFGRDKVLFADPYTGAVLGEGAETTRGFFRSVTSWHRWLGTNEKGRAVGRAITGACNLAFLFLVISGFYLWWPRKWSALKSVILFNRRLRGKARDWNWHNVIGFWCAPALFFIVLTGVIMSYPWANNLLYRLTNSEPPPLRAGGISREKMPAADSDFSGLNEVWNRAEKEIPNWKSIALRMPVSGDAPFNFTLDFGNGGRPDKRVQLAFDRKTGDIISRETFETYNAGRKLRLWARFVHTGEAGGVLGQFVAMLASLGAAVLVYTGFSLAWRRFCERKNLLRNK